MKLHNFSLLVFSGITLAASICSCESKAKLASNVIGTWAGTPEKIADSDAMSATAIRMIQFLPADDDKVSGTLHMSALVTITQALNSDPQLIEPYTASATGIASISGQWSAIDHDEIILHLTDSTMTVNVDPDGIMVKVNSITGQTISSVDSIKPYISENIKRQISSAVRNQIFNSAKIDDIKISNNLMSCEIGHKDLTLRRQDTTVR